MRLEEALRGDQTTERGPWLGIGKKAVRTLRTHLPAPQVHEVGGIHAALDRLGRMQVMGCLADEGAFRTRPSAAIDVLTKHLGEAPLWLLEPSPLLRRLATHAGALCVEAGRDLGARDRSGTAIPTVAGPADAALDTFEAGCLERQKDPAELEAWTVESFLELTQAQQVSLHALDRHGRLKAGRSIDRQGKTHESTPLEVQRDLAQRTLQAGRPTVGTLSWAYMKRPDARGYTLLPAGEHRLIAALGVPDALLEDAALLRLLGTRALHAGRALDVAHRLAQALESALTDPLTGLPNRRAFEEAFRRQAERSRRTGEHFALVFFDIDHFHQVNVDLTHKIADEVLEEVATRLGAAFRDSDFVARWGGEEFAALLSPIEKDSGDRVLDAADRARMKVRRPAIDLSTGRSFLTTISGGLVISPEDATEPKRLESIVSKALLRAKDDGRDRVYRANQDDIAACEA